MRKVWEIRRVRESLVEHLAASLDVPPIIARVLIHRGAASPQAANDFLCSDLSALAPPDQMEDLTKAVRLIRKAIADGEKILLVGDYDVDGLTSAAILYRTLRELGAKVTCHIPHRMSDGYGLKEEVIRRAASAQVKLLLTVDCGTTSFAELTLAKRLGMKTVVVDHHELLPAGRPPAAAFLNPLQPDCHYPCKDLASAGVAFTLFRGLAEGQPQAHLWEHLDLAALGTVADVAPLIGENRILVKAGLHRLSGTHKPGLKALLSSAKLSGQSLSSEDIGYGLGPRLNAMGRTGSAGETFRLLVTEDPHEAHAIVKKIEQENKTRRVLEREALRRALVKVEREVNFSSDRVIVLEDERWHPGVLGIVANRLAARFHRPVVVIARTGPLCRGSARSIRAFPLVEALEQVKDHLVEFGGHPAAAGLTIAADRIASFREAINRVAHRKINPRHLTHSLEVDGELPLSALTNGLMRDLDTLAPFGAGNPRPVFVSDDARIPVPSQEPGAAKIPFSPFGIRFLIEDARGRSFHALQSRYDFGEGLNVRRLAAGPISLAYSPVRRLETDGHRIELKLCDLKLPQ